MRALTAEQFSAADAVGGVRGVVESVAPGLLFVVVFIASGQRLAPALIAASAAAVVAVIVRLVQRTPVDPGVLRAARRRHRRDLGLAVRGRVRLLRVRAVGQRRLPRRDAACRSSSGWPLVGLVMGLFRPGGPAASGGSWAAAVAWRADPALRRRYALATWPWVAMFALRLVVQVPLYLGRPGRVAGHGEAGDGAAAHRAGAVAQLVAGPRVSSASSSASSASRAVTNSSSSRPSSVSSALGAIGRASRTMHASTVSAGHSI